MWEINSSQIQAVAGMMFSINEPTWMGTDYNLGGLSLKNLFLCFEFKRTKATLISTVPKYTSQLVMKELKLSDVALIKSLFS